MKLLHRTLAHAIDGTATALARGLMFSRSRPTSKTLDELGVYREYSIHEMFESDVSVPDVTRGATRRRGGFEWTDLEFASPVTHISRRSQTLHRGPYACNSQVHARWIRHADPKSRPTMLFLHSWMSPLSSAEDRLLLPRFAKKLDVDVLSMHLPYHGRRKPTGSAFHGEYFWTADLVRTFEALRQSVADARALISWVQHQAPTPVGVMGVSLGGMVSLALTCFEERLAFAIPVAAHLDLAGVLADAGLLVPMKRELQRHGWGPEDVHHYTRSLGLHVLMPCIQRQRILFVAGRYDRILHSDRTTALWYHWGQPAMHWFDGGHLGILTHMGGTLKASRSFIDDLRPGMPRPRKPPRHRGDRAVAEVAGLASPEEAQVTDAA